MKVRSDDVARAFASGAVKSRLYLFHGADAAGSAALAAGLGRTLGPDAERVALAPAMLKADPALLADEAASLSLFGTRRWVLVEGGGDELLDAVGALLATPASGNPVGIVAGALKKTSKLLALVENSPLATACASYIPEGRDAERMVVELGRTAGLAIAPELARRLASASGNDRALIAQEIDKFATYLDAAPDRSTPLDDATVDLLSAGNADGDLSRVVDAVLDGDTRALDQQLTRLTAGGTDGMAALRALGRRILLLGRLRADVEGGSSVDAVLASAGRALYPREKASVSHQLGRWTATRLATALGRVAQAERDFKSAGSLGADAIAEPLFAIARAASPRR